MRTLLSGSYKKSEISTIVDSMTREEMAWTIKMIIDRMLLVNTDVGTKEEKKPSWWNRPLMESTQALFPSERRDLGDNYKNQLTDILEEKCL